MHHPGLAENGKRDLAHRRRLIKELAARLERDRQLRYAEREFEMQRLLMGKGGKKKIQGVEKVEGDDDDDEAETQDEIDARRGRKQKSSRKVVDETTYRPRVYKWRLERKR
jgi:U3 small nucleolar RNA-associated protein 11